MAHTKAQKAVKGNRDSRSKRLGIKLYGGQIAKAGNIIVRQKGSKVNPGVGVLLSKDFTLVALRAGIVRFFTKHDKQYVTVENEVIASKEVAVSA
jgi:large subunit ribosomal protein L27